MKLSQLIQDVESARRNIISNCHNLSMDTVTYKETPEDWTITEIIEHLVRAEWGGVSGIWQAIDGYRNHLPIWKGENTNAGLSIEEIVKNTWLPHQPAPEPARPQWGGSIEFWLISLDNCKHTLYALHESLKGLDPEKIIYPHPLSGPLDVYQRLEFLRYHIERHQLQIEKIKSGLV